MGAFVDRLGDRYGRLVVISREPNRNHRAFWLCACDCGIEKVISADSLRSGLTRSCGCLQREVAASSLIRLHEAGKGGERHGHASHGSVTRTYRSWGSMRRRVLEPTHQAYSRYGGAGITICDRWLHSFANFLEDMGERPDGRTLDRIDPYGNYEPSNCRWATPSEQRVNRRVA